MGFTLTRTAVNTVAGNMRLRVLRLSEDTGGDFGFAVGGGGQRFLKMQGVNTVDVNVSHSREATSTTDKNREPGQAFFGGVSIAVYQLMIVSAG